MLLLIASYGLRGCEARALRLSDIDWVHDQITIFASTTGRRRRLPLTRPAGEAILDYLLADRPPSPHEEVFVSSRPPHGPLRSKMNPWLGRQPGEAGIVTPRRGAHILRHWLAVHLLRSGETLKSIGDVPGRRHPDTTFIYTKLHARGSPDGGAGAGGGVVTTGGFCGPLASEFAAFAATLEASASASKTTLTQLRALDRFTRQHGLPSGTTGETPARA